MAAKFFGQFLLERGVIDARQLLAALELQRASNPALGELAQARGLLDAAQAQAINERQRSEDRRFGDIACEMGLLEATQVESLLAEQQQHRKLFGEILVEQGMLDRATLEAELQAHQAERSQALHELGASLAGHPLERLANGAIDTCNKLFLRILRTQSQFASVAAGPDALVRYPVCACVRVDAEHPLRIALACDSATAAAFAGAFLTIAPVACDEALARDALGELVNVLMGYVVKDTLPDDARYRPAPPDFAHTAAELAAEPGMVAVAMTSQRGPFALLVGSSI